MHAYTHACLHTYKVTAPLHHRLIESGWNVLVFDAMPSTGTHVCMHACAHACAHMHKALRTNVLVFDAMPSTGDGVREACTLYPVPCTGDGVREACTLYPVPCTLHRRGVREACTLYPVPCTGDGVREAAKLHAAMAYCATHRKLRYCRTSLLTQGTHVCVH